MQIGTKAFLQGPQGSLSDHPSSSTESPPAPGSPVQGPGGHGGVARQSCLLKKKKKKKGPSFLLWQ